MRENSASKGGGIYWRPAEGTLKSQFALFGIQVPILQMELLSEGPLRLV